MCIVGFFTEALVERCLVRPKIFPGADVSGQHNILESFKTLAPHVRAPPWARLQTKESVVVKRGATADRRNEGEPDGYF